jgi:hypothetical protein
LDFDAKGNITGAGETPAVRRATAKGKGEVWGPEEAWGVSGICSGRRLAVVGPAVVVTCTWKGAVALAARVIGVGITVQVAPAGAPEQVSGTGPAKPSMDWRLSW